MRFAQARQGRGSRYSKTGRPAFYGRLIATGVLYSGMFYPQVRADLLQPVIPKSCDRPGNIALINEAPILINVQGEHGPEAETRFLWAVRYLLAIAHKESIQ